MNIDRKHIGQTIRKVLSFAIKHILLLANLFFAQLYMFGVFSTFVSPNRIVIFSYFGLIFPILAIINVVFIAIWTFRRSWLALISLVTIVFTYAHFNRVFTVPVYRLVHHSAEQSLKLMSYNILSVDGPKDFEGFLNFIDSVDADVVCFQEFGYYKKGNRPLERAMKERYPHSHIWYKTDKKTYCTGVATFSRYPIANKRLVDYESYSNLSIASDLVVGGDTIRLINNHLESNKFTKAVLDEYNSLNDTISQDRLVEVSTKMYHKLAKAYSIRAIQAVEVRQEIDRSPYITVVCGDFNDVPESYVYRKIKGDMRDVFTDTSWGYRYTYTKNRMLVGIDHVFIHKTLIPLSHTIPHVSYSDHYPVIVTFGNKSAK